MDENEGSSTTPQALETADATRRAAEGTPESGLSVPRKSDAPKPSTGLSDPSKPAVRKPAAPKKPAARKPAAPKSSSASKSGTKKPGSPKQPAAAKAGTSTAAAKPLAVDDIVLTVDPSILAIDLAEPKVTAETVLSVRGLTKRYAGTVAVAGIDLEVRAGDFYGIVGPNGAGKTTTLSMITGLLRPDSGEIHVHGIDVARNPAAAKRIMGVLPDRLRLFDRLTGAQFLFYTGILRGLAAPVVRQRGADLARAFAFEDALGRLVSDYSIGMSKKLALAAAMIHSPRLLVLDEPFDAVDPVSADIITGILSNYAAAGGTVVVSSHSMDLVQRICDHVAVIVDGAVLADGTMDQVRAGGTLEHRFLELAGGSRSAEGLKWLHNFSD